MPKYFKQTSKKKATIIANYNGCCATCNKPFNLLHYPFIPDCFISIINLAEPKTIDNFKPLCGKCVHVINKRNLVNCKKRENEILL